MRKLADIFRERERAEQDDRPGRSRSDARRSERVLERTLVALAEELVALKRTQLERLQLPEELFDAVVDARAITSGSARKRQLRLVRVHLRDAGWASLRARLDEMAAGRGPEYQASPEAVQWAMRLVAEDDLALEQLLTECPGAERGHLRQLTRAVRNASGVRQTKARQKLTAALDSLLRR